MEESKSWEERLAMLESRQARLEHDFDRHKEECSEHSDSVNMRLKEGDVLFNRMKTEIDFVSGLVDHRFGEFDKALVTLRRELKVEIKELTKLVVDQLGIAISHMRYGKSPDEIKVIEACEPDLEDTIPPPSQEGG